MRDPDEVIDEALRAEERELLRAIGEEPGYLSQALGLFGGRTGWVAAVLMVVQAVLFVGGAYAAWRFFEASEPLAAVHWGLPAATLLIMSLTVKMALWPAMHANRLMRELKRIELQIALAQRTP